MPTTKRRINISLPKSVNTVLDKVAKRDNQPVAAKALELIMYALEIEEDILWDSSAKKRDTKKATYIAHDDAWL